MNKNFEMAVNDILLHEGGYINHPTDPGGETKYGISKRSYPNLDIKNLTEEQAVAIYYKDYWLVNHLEEIHNQDVATKFLNLFVNVGKKSAERVICRALRACGFKYDEQNINLNDLINATNIMSEKSRILELLSALRSETAGYYRILSVEKPALKAFLKGWLNRAYS